MRDYIVLAPPLPARDGAPEALRLVFVKDGFCWPGLLITLPWLLYRRLFVEAALYVLVVAGLAFLGERFGAPATFLTAALPVAFGVLGNDLRRFALRRRGFLPRGVASGANIEEAEIRYFLGLPAADSVPLPPRIPPSHPATMPGQAPGSVIGLFPQAEGAR
ncbi:DUF2628 domain-containing protein [Mesorhizobium sp. BR1-1-16]|uniref:DUF2628 domain-containing protein n=1 Tax=Mesorhizobium sp. BR1-1-16 TaxID=2876653 RepID=UPI001CCD6830|nr:DUF2628 domain-containing protein [Mesorhizobium sp. BR1-1-16]MBZ9938036.1 DUF2628 domain-containing protein [Mesorhizobium sp. BR1-1-16]